jgi:hypothetical protein
MLVADVLSTDATARQPHREGIAQPEDRVIPASRLDRLDIQVRPLGNCAATRRRTSGRSICTSAAGLVPGPEPNAPPSGDQG